MLFYLDNLLGLLAQRLLVTSLRFWFCGHEDIPPQFLLDIYGETVSFSLPGFRPPWGGLSGTKGNEVLHWPALV